MANGNARAIETTVMAHDPSRGELLVLAPATDDATFATVRGRVVLVEWTSTACFHQLEGTMIDVAAGVLPMWRIEVGEEPEAVNRRRFVRVRKEGPVPLTVGVVEVEGRIINISEGGLRFEVPADALVTAVVRSPAPGPSAAGLPDAAPGPSLGGEERIGLGSHLAVSIDLGTEGAFAAGGKVAWVRRTGRRLEVGISFDALPEGKVNVLRRHVFSLERRSRRAAERS